MGDFGELVLIIGDFHIPHRASSIPDKFQRMFVPNKMQHVLCTGNLSTKEQYDELRSLAPNVHVVRGSFDDNASFPDTKVIQIGQFKVGLVSGHQIVPWGDLQSLAMVLPLTSSFSSAFLSSFLFKRFLSSLPATTAHDSKFFVLLVLDATAIRCRHSYIWSHA